MAEKFTPYGLTSLPAYADRDINGIYFIRTATGMRIFGIANDGKKSEVEVEIPGDFETLSSGNLLLKKLEEFLMTPNDHFGISAHKAGNRSFLTIQNAFEANKMFQLNMQFPNTEAHMDVTVEPASSPVKMMMKYEFDFHTQVILSASTNTIQTTLSTRINGWSSSYIAELTSKSWDIVWTELSGTTSYNCSVKDMYAVSLPSGITLFPLRISMGTTGLLQLHHSRQLTQEIKIPVGAKLIFIKHENTNRNINRCIL